MKNDLIEKTELGYVVRGFDDTGNRIIIGVTHTLSAAIEMRHQYIFESLTEEDIYGIG